MIDAVIEVNNPSRLHEVLYSAAPRTPGLTAALHSLRDELADLVAALLLTETSDDEGAFRATRRQLLRSRLDLQRRLPAPGLNSGTGHAHRRRDAPGDGRTSTTSPASKGTSPSPDSSH